MITLTRVVLTSMPLPQAGSATDKNDRGQVLLVAGSRDVPGAAILCAEAALGAGAGKVQVAVPKDFAVPLGIALPETAVIECVVEHPSMHRKIPMRSAVDHADANLVGPGFMEEERSHQLAANILQIASKMIVLDAGALLKLSDVIDAVRAQRGRIVLTPHAGKMSRLLGWDKKEVENDPVGAVQLAAERFQAVVALKGAVTYFADPDCQIYRNENGAIGLETGGSGDVLAGLITAFFGARMPSFAGGAMGRVSPRRGWRSAYKKRGYSRFPWP